MLPISISSICFPQPQSGSPAPGLLVSEGRLLDLSAIMRAERQRGRPDHPALLTALTGYAQGKAPRNWSGTTRNALRFWHSQTRLHRLFPKRHLSALAVSSPVLRPASGGTGQLGHVALTAAS